MARKLSPELAAKRRREQGAKRMSRLRENRKRKGLERVEVEAYPPDVAAIKALAHHLQAAREKSE